MLERGCAYCGSTAKLTREHLWPAALHRRLLEANKSPQSLFWLRRVGAEIQGEPKLRDVCQACNNGPLSELDTYVCKLFDIYFIKIAQRFDKVHFEYDYHLLKRWLLKMSFNSARIHSAIDLLVFPPLLPYINGKSLMAGRSCMMYVQLSYPGTVPAENLRDFATGDPPLVWEPLDNRVGHMWFSVDGLGRKLLRAVHLRSFSFFLAFFEPGKNSPDVAEFNASFATMPGTTLLLASRQHVELICNGSDAWNSYNGARENAIVEG